MIDQISNYLFSVGMIAKRFMLQTITIIITITIICFYSFTSVGASDASDASDASEKFKVNWLAISSLDELEKTWQKSLVYLPDDMGGHFGRLLQDGRLEDAVSKLKAKEKKPLLLLMHYCEGLGHHREDMKRFAKLGFIVIGPNSFAREHRPLGCYEDKSKFIRYFDAAVAMQKAELDYAVRKLSTFDWIDKKNLLLFGSGLGGLVVAHYEGNEFNGHLIEGWGCRGPNPIFDGIWAPPEVRVFASVSSNTPFLVKNPGFSVDCASFIEDRKNSVSIVLDRPAHQVAWYPQSLKPMIKFLMRNMDVDIETVSEDVPTILEKSSSKIHLVEKWSDTAVHETSKAHCAAFGKKSRLTGEPINGIYKYSCD